jgi:hypothetical protein
MSYGRRPPEGDLEAIKGALDTLHVAMGHARLYGGSHKETYATLERSLREMTPMLAQYGSLQLDSGPEGLTWQGVLVRSEDEELSGLGRMLHREGVANITFGSDVPLAELIRLMDVLRVNFELPEYEEETLESLLWQAGFQRIGFQAVAALMEAEALSGQLSSNQPFETDIDAALRNITQLELSDMRTGRRNLGQVAEETVHKALAGSDLAGLGPDDSASLSQEARRWHVEFVQDGTEDAEEIRALRAEVEGEGHGDLIARLIGTLMRSVVANRSELAARDAITLARQAVEEVYRRSDAQGLVCILDEGTELMQEPATREAPLVGPVRDFYASAISPRRIARVLLTLDPEQMDGDGAHLRRLVERLPDSVLQSIVEAAGRDKDKRRAARLQQTLGAVVGDRIDTWLANCIKQPPEMVLPTIALARSLGRVRGGRSRAALLAHSSRLVRLEILRWYADTMAPEDLKQILPLVADSNKDVRRAAGAVLVAHRPYEAVKWLRRLVVAENFAKRDAALKTDVSIIFGLVAQDGAVDVLEKMLAIKPARGDKAALESVQAAARGLAAVGSVAAKQALKRNAGGLFSAKKPICADALKRLEGGSPW